MGINYVLTGTVNFNMKGGIIYIILNHYYYCSFLPVANDCS